MTTLNTIVVGIDGQQGGWDALALTCRLASLDGATITVVCAYPAIAVQHAPLIWPHIKLPADAERVLRDPRARLDGDDGVWYAAMAGSTPGSVLQRAADDTDADLIVIGSSHRALLGRVLGGDIVAQALDHPPCPIAVAPCGTDRSDAPLARIGIGVDATPRSYEAVRRAAELTNPLLTARTLELIHVSAHTDEPVDAVALQGRSPLEHLSDDYGPQAYAALRHVACLGSDVTIGWTDATGAVASTLDEYTTGLDLLVIGTHGPGPLGRLLHGAVDRDVAQGAQCAVVAVPRSHATPERVVGARDDAVTGDSA